MKKAREEEKSLWEDNLWWQRSEVLGKLADSTDLWCRTNIIGQMQYCCKHDEETLPNGSIVITDKAAALPRFVADSLGSDSISLFLLNLALMYVYIHLKVLLICGPQSPKLINTNTKWVDNACSRGLPSATIACFRSHNPFLCSLYDNMPSYSIV